MEQWQQFQRQVFDGIFRKIDAEDPLQHLADELGLSRNTIYKRYAGYTPLHLEELLRLARDYSISIDNLLHTPSDHFEFYFPHTRKTRPDPYTYLTNIGKDLDFMIRSGNPSVWYVSDEIPFFQYMHFDLLFAFKLCIWGRLIWTPEGSSEASISPVELMESVLKNTRLRELREQILHMYLRIPTMEIWSTPVVDNTIEQIRYLVFTGQLRDPKMIGSILEDMEHLTDHLRLQAERGRKFAITADDPTSSSLELYHNEMTHTNNTILTRCDAGRKIYLTYDNPNYMTCDDEALCDYTEDWIMNLQRQSMLIAKTAEKHREHYFGEIREKVRQLRHEFNI